MLAEYLEKFSTLNMNSQNGRKSPHKVCMLLAVMDLIQAGKIYEPKVQLDGVLRERFTHYFEQFRSGNDSDKPEQPFFHLRGEGFWRIAYNAGFRAEEVSRYSKKAVSHAEIDIELFNYMKSPIVSNDLKIALTENFPDLPEMFGRWLMEIGTSEKTAKDYLQAVQGPISTWLGEHGLVAESLSEVKSYRKLTELTEKAKQLSGFAEFDGRVRGMHSKALTSYARFLADLSQIDVKADVQTILQDDRLSETEKSILVNTRMGQGSFRRQLISMWNGCAVTGYCNAQMLVASHIKPWRAADNQERLDKFNGLLLLANLDKAFDLGFISFDDDGRLMLSDQLEQPKVLGIQSGMGFEVRPEHRGYLDYHRQERFRR